MTLDENIIKERLDDLIDFKSQNDEKINELEKAIFEKESRLESITRRLGVLEDRLNFQREIES